MSHIVTVTGRVPASETGAVSIGERLVATLPVPRPKRATDSAFYDQPVTIERLGALMTGRANRHDATLDAGTARTELTRFAAAGGGLVVDITSAAEGRDVDTLAALSAHTGVHVVAAAGPHPDAERTVADLHTGRFGIVVVPACADGVARAAAFDAAARTGAPVLADAATTGLDVLVREAGECGLVPERLAVHGLRALAHDTARLREAAGLGVRLVFDGLGRIPTVHTVVSDHDIAAALAALVAAGFGDRLMVGAGLSRKHAFTAFGGHGLPFLPRQFGPYLGMLGVGPADVARILEDNARTFLTWKDAA